ncbi:hypothetical protein [Deinococcus sp. Arct2-2]|nr:hypothetical protein [Deinococcus sp. Arct2-2]
MFHDPIHQVQQFSHGSAYDHHFWFAFGLKAQLNCPPAVNAAI